MPDDMPIQHKFVSKAVESAQRKVENINFSTRKNVLEYDDVMNKQRQVIYAERNMILDGKDLSDHVSDVIKDTVARCVQEFCATDSHEGERDLEGLHKWVVELTGNVDAPQFADSAYDELNAEVLAYVQKCYDAKAERLGEDLMRELNRQVMLRVIDTRWMNYLQEMDYLKTGIGLRGFGQRDPLVEYKSEAFAAFQTLVDTMYEDYLRTVVAHRGQERSRAVRHDAPAELEGAQYSGPGEVDGDDAIRAPFAGRGLAARRSHHRHGRLRRCQFLRPRADLPQGQMTGRPLCGRGAQRAVSLVARGKKFKQLPWEEPRAGRADIMSDLGRGPGRPEQRVWPRSRAYLHVDESRAPVVAELERRKRRGRAFG